MTLRSRLIEAGAERLLGQPIEVAREHRSHMVDAAVAESEMILDAFLDDLEANAPEWDLAALRIATSNEPFHWLVGNFIAVLRDGGDESEDTDD